MVLTDYYLIELSIKISDALLKSNKRSTVLLNNARFTGELSTSRNRYFELNTHVWN